MTIEPKKGILFVTSGPSGSGKTTLCRMIEKELKIDHHVSYTTRPARNAELHGKDYYFISDEEFDQKIKEGFFAEWAQVHSKRYGTAQNEIEKILNLGKHLILDLDTQGALSIKKKYPDSVLIFIDVHDDDLKQRLDKRGSESKEQLEKRLKQVAIEREMIPHYDYVLYNHELSQAFEELFQFITKKI